MTDKTSKNKIDKLNKIINDILYSGHFRKFSDEFFLTYKHEIYVIFSNLIKLGFFKLENNDYTFNCPKFVSESSAINIFYLFPREVDYHFKIKDLNEQINARHTAFENAIVEIKTLIED
jgi:hypothetical protein